MTINDYHFRYQSIERWFSPRRTRAPRGRWTSRSPPRLEGGRSTLGPLSKVCVIRSSIFLSNSYILFSDNSKYKAPVTVSDMLPQVNQVKREAWRKLGVNVGVLRTSIPDFKWIYSTIQGPTRPPGGSGGNLHSFTSTMRLENFYISLNLFFPWKSNSVLFSLISFSVFLKGAYCKFFQVLMDTIMPSWRRGANTKPNLISCSWSFLLWVNSKQVKLESWSKSPGVRYEHTQSQHQTKSNQLQLVLSALSKQ